MDIADRVSKPPRSKARGPLARIADISETRFWAYYLLLPSIVVILAVVLYPTLWGISLSFREMRLNRLDLGTGFVGLKHYYAMAADPVFWLALQNTVVWTVGRRRPASCCSALARRCCSNKELPGFRAASVLILLPWFLPNVVAGHMWA